MYDNYLFGLGQGLQAGLAVSVLIAWLTGTGRRGPLRPVLAGAAAAVCWWSAAGLAVEFGSAGLTARAAELVGGVTAVAAAAMAGRLVLRLALRPERDRPGRDRPWERGALFATVFLLVGREGLDSAVFGWSALRSAADPQGSAAPPLLLLLGAATAGALCLLVPRAVTRLPRARLLPWTVGVLATVTAGVLGSGVRRLQEARLLPGAEESAFDLGSVLPADSWYGVVSTAVLGTPPDPTDLQFTVWALCLVPALALPLAPVGFGRSAGGEGKTTDEKADSGERSASTRRPGPDPAGAGGRGGAGADGERLCDGPRRAGRGALGDEG
ncbi:FTR1 family protein [Streptomyces sp. NPDC014894]|uniref:FTR1 family protein n=1 Tax=unclassified Streptomyces TaxID=2593676 RepID=UPI0037010843